MLFADAQVDFLKLYVDSSFKNEDNLKPDLRSGYRLGQDQVAEFLQLRYETNFLLAPYICSFFLFVPEHELALYY